MTQSRSQGLSSPDPLGWEEERPWNEVDTDRDVVRRYLMLITSLYIPMLHFPWLPAQQI